MMKKFCPFCLTIHDFDEPPICPNRVDIDGEHPEIPREYILNYGINKPLWLAAIGFSRHGKTSYIGAVTSVLENSYKFWDDITISYSDQYTDQAIQKIRRLIRERKADAPTRPAYSFGGNDKGDADPETNEQVPRPLIIQVDSIPKFDSRSLVVYDTAGEYFDTLTGIADEASQTGYLKSLKAVKNLWFMISLTDLEKLENSESQGAFGSTVVSGKRKSQNIRDLLNIYFVGMQRMGWDIRGNNLIVVYTKGDKLKGKLPESVMEYLDSDPYGVVAKQVNDYYQPIQREGFDIGTYLKRMAEISDALRDFTKTNIPAGAAFLNLARKYELNVRFTVTSALGADLQGEDKVAIADITSFRVLDPLLWALELDQGELSVTTIKLILDTNTNASASNQVFFLDIQRIIQGLQKIGDEVITYYLGRIKPCAESGRKLPEFPPKQTYPRLLKPLVADDNENSYALVITTAALLDDDDFRTLKSIWKNRLLIVSLDDDYEPAWEPSINFRQGEKVNIIVNQFKKMLQQASN